MALKMTWVRSFVWVGSWRRGKSPHRWKSRRAVVRALRYLAGGILLEFLTHGLRHGLRSFARYAGCAEQAYR